MAFFANFEQKYDKQLSTLKVHTDVILICLPIQTYLFAGAIPALIFPFAGLATSYIGAAKYDDY